MSRYTVPDTSSPLATAGIIAAEHIYCGNLLWVSAATNRFVLVIALLRNGRARY